MVEREKLRWYWSQNVSRAGLRAQGFDITLTQRRIAAAGELSEGVKGRQTWRQTEAEINLKGLPVEDVDIILLLFDL